MADVAAAIARYTERLTTLQDYRDRHPGATTLGQKRLNRVFNSLVNGVDSDKAQSEFTSSERNEIEYRKQRARLLRMQAEEDPNAPLPSKARSDRYPAWARGSLTADDEARRYPYRRSATAGLAQLDAARAARIDAEQRLAVFRRGLPRDMSIHGESADHIDVDGNTFGIPTLKNGKLRGASFGYGTAGGFASSPYGSLSGIRAKIDETKSALDGLNTTVTPNVNAAGLDQLSQKLGQVLGQLNALRAGVDVPITTTVKGDQPNLGALHRGSFTPSGDPGR